MAHAVLKTEEDERNWQKTLSRLAEIKDLCDKNSIEIILVYLPYISAMDWGYYTAAAGKDASGYDRDMPIKRVKKLTDSLKIPSLDLTPAMIHQGGKKLYFKFDNHLNERGHKVVAAEVANWLIEEIRLLNRAEGTL
jgi:hypothetical protein